MPAVTVMDTVGNAMPSPSERGRRDERGARALGEPGHDQHDERRGQPGGQGRQPEQHQPGQEQPPVAGQIADPAAGQQQGAEG
jgi:hypothetical protein